MSTQKWKDQSILTRCLLTFASTISGIGACYLCYRCYNNYSSKSKNPILSSQDLVSFAKLMGNLKSTRRTGWVRKNVESPESIADHMYRMSILAWLFGDQTNNMKLDINKMIKMALVHDMIESICGDIVPIYKISGVTKEQKYKLEFDALKKIRYQYLKNTNIGIEIYNLWIEYENQNTNEAIIVKDLDKLDMILQAYEYELKQKNMDLSDFFKNTVGKFKSDVGKRFEMELLRQRNATLNTR
mmetsp:Transcript_32752/g.40247  ORF Transcript_32752/g.40247 Transcript_32752/m.40247 type:complete len:243 (-) Transcript_32752:56-784(-)